MKKYIYSLMVMLLALLSVGFTACGNDDEPKVPVIVGTWQHNHHHSGTNDWDIYYHFTKDGKFYHVWNAYMIDPKDGFIPVTSVYHGTYTVSGTKLIVTLDPGAMSDDLPLCPSECEYSVQGNTLKLLGGDEPTFTRVDDNVIQPYL